MIHRCLIGMIMMAAATVSVAECDDRTAKDVANKAAEALMNGSSFRLPVVLKRHHPSRTKEVATYIKAGDLYYSVFYLVDGNCTPGFIKRTQGKY
ncbi:hypothetical protein [Maribrevibacterium harenarium]|nr:hypothetical protein [Maribrevibacterium harenarium]